jgi:YVTN family beta-propeller protein
MDEMEQLEQMCAEVPPPDRQRLAEARGRVMTAIAGSSRGASHAARRPWLATFWKRRRRWLGWAAPLAAAAVVVAVILGTQGVFGTIHRPAPAASGHGLGPTPGLPVTAYVLNVFSGTVTPIRTATDTALAPIRVGTAGEAPTAMAITPDGKTIYVADWVANPHQQGTVVPVRTATDTALAPIKVGDYPISIAITPDGQTAFVANEVSGPVTPIRTVTSTALAPIKVGADPGTIAITPAGQTAYVLSHGSDTVTPIQTATNQALAPIKVGTMPDVIVITP